MPHSRDDIIDDDSNARERYLRKHHPTGWRLVLRQMRYRLEYGAFLLFRALMRALGPDRASWFSGQLWRLIAPHTRRHDRALSNLAVSLPELTDEQRHSITRGMWENLGRVTAEALMLDDIIADPERISFSVDDAIAAIHRAGGRAVVVSLHMGNWELTSTAATRNNIAVAGVYQRILNPYIDRSVVKMRNSGYPGGLHAKGANTARKLMEWVKSGHAIAFLADQRHVSGISVPFFGRPAPSNPFPAMVARRFDVPLIVARVLRLDGVRFHIDADVLPLSWTPNRDSDIAQATAAMQAVFERWIRENPEQWMWGHRRWG